jgi:exosortase
VARAFVPPTGHAVETAMFRPTQLPLPLVLGVAAWLVWRRRERIAAAAPGARTVAALLAVASAAAYGWATLTRSPDWLLISLAAGLLAFGGAARGPAGARALALPASALLLGVEVPVPIRQEIVWALQRATSIAAGQLLAPIREGFLQEGVILRNGEHSFHVIDGCSGLQGMSILVLIAVLVGELLELAPRRRVLLAAIALPLGYALNVVRIAYIAGSANPEAYAGAGGDHTPQGLALLGVGTAALYALGYAIAEAPRRADRRASAPRARGDAIWWQAAIALAAFCALSVAIAPFAPRAAAGGLLTASFPEAQAGWISEPIAGDPYFYGSPPAGAMIYRRYTRGGDPQLTDVVDVLIAVDQDPPLDTSELFASKLRLPGPEWDVVSRRTEQLWDLGRKADYAIAARESRPERAVAYTWKIRDDGVLGESARSLFALEQTPWRRARNRVVVRLVAFAPFDDPLAIDRAKRRLDRFTSGFRDSFSAL